MFDAIDRSTFAPISCERKAKRTGALINAVDLRSTNFAHGTRCNTAPVWRSSHSANAVGYVNQDISYHQEPSAMAVLHLDGPATFGNCIIALMVCLMFVITDTSAADKPDQQSET